MGVGSPYLAAPSNGGVRGNLSGNFGRGPRRGQPLIGPIVVGGYPYYYYPDSYDNPADYAQPQQQVTADQQTVPMDETQQGVNDSGSPLAISPRPAAAVPDVGDFIFVRKDGRILFASAFSVTGDQLRYVTPEGIRRSLPTAELDAAATQQMNEARGTTVQLLLHN